MDLPAELFADVTGVSPEAVSVYEGNHERRKHPRVAFGSRARIYPLMDIAGHRGAPIMVRDISLSGIGFLSQDELSVGDEFIVRLNRISTAARLAVQCMVQRCEKGGTGSTQYEVGATFELVLDASQAEPPPATNPAEARSPEAVPTLGGNADPRVGGRGRAAYEGVDRAETKRLRARLGRRMPLRQRVRWLISCLNPLNVVRGLIRVARRTSDATAEAAPVESPADGQLFGAEPAPTVPEAATAPDSSSASPEAVDPEKPHVSIFAHLPVPAPEPAAAAAGTEPTDQPAPPQADAPPPAAQSPLAVAEVAVATPEPIAPTPAASSVVIPPVQSEAPAAEIPPASQPQPQPQPSWATSASQPPPAPLPPLPAGEQESEDSGTGTRRAGRPSAPIVRPPRARRKRPIFPSESSASQGGRTQRLGF